MRFREDNLGSIFLFLWMRLVHLWIVVDYEKGDILGSCDLSDGNCFH